MRLPPADELPYGGIIGHVTLLDCVRKSQSLWFDGPVGWMLADPHPLPFQRTRGYLYLFDAPGGVVSPNDWGVSRRGVNALSEEP